MFYPFILMDIQAGNGLSRPLDAARRISRRCRGAGGSRWRRRPGGRGRPTRRRRRRTEVAAFFGHGRRPAISRSSGSTVELHRAGGVVVPAVRAALCASLRAGGRGRCLLHRLGAARADADPRLGATAIRRCGRCATLAEDVRAILGPGTKIGYAADWSEYFGHQPADGSGDVLFHLDPLWASPAIDFVGIDNYMPLSDWRDGTGPRRRGGRVDLRSRLSDGQRRRRRGVRLVLCRRGRARGAGAPADHRRRLRRALGLSLQGPGELVVEAARRPARRGQGRRAHGLAAAVEADLVHRARLPGGRQGHQPAERVPRPEVVGELLSLLIRAGRGTTSSSIATSRRRSRTGTIRRTTRRRTSMAGGWSTCRARMSGRGTRGPGRTFPDRLETWVDGRELRARALAERAGEPRRARRRWWRRSARGAGSTTIDVARLHGGGDGLSDRGGRERAAEPAAADAGLWLRQLRGRTGSWSSPTAAAAVAAEIAPGRCVAVGREPVVVADAGAGGGDGGPGHGRVRAGGHGLPAGGGRRRWRRRRRSRGPSRRRCRSCSSRARRGRSPSAR